MYMNKNITMINEFPMLFLHLVHGEFCEPPPRNKWSLS